MGKTTDNLIGAINGAFGDKLAESKNPLAQEMALHFNGQRLGHSDALEKALKASSSKALVILIHGLGNTEHIWDFKSKHKEAASDLSGIQPAAPDSYGERLHNSFDITPLFLRYNTGLSIEDNAAHFEELVSLLARQYSDEIEELILIGFSMGGLVSRMAQGIARKNKPRSPWLNKLRHAFYLGTPHEGAPLERLTNITSNLLGKMPKQYISVWSEQLNLRSTGVKNLGDRLSEDTIFCFSEDCSHYFISGSLWQENQKIANYLLGDSLVRMDSACPADRPAQSKTAAIYGIDHIRLAHSERVWSQIYDWLEPAYELSDTRNPQTSSRSVYPTEHSKQPSQRAQGAINAFASTSSHIINLVETMHSSIAKEPFGILNQVPSVKHVSSPIEKTQSLISTSVYDLLRSATKKIKVTRSDSSQTKDI